MPRRAGGLLLGLAMLAAIAGLIALGVWQLERRAWKLDLIARVDARLAAAPVAAPGPADWPQLSADRDAYTRVRVAGRYLHDREVAVQAVTERGPGYWILTPLADPRLHRAGQPRLRAARAPRPRDPARGPGPGRGQRHRPPPPQRARRRLPAPQRPRRRPLVLARRRRHRRRPAARAGGALLHRRRRHPEPRRPAGRRPDRGPLPQQPPRLRADLVRPRRRPRRRRPSSPCGARTPAPTRREPATPDRGRRARCSGPPVAARAEPRTAPPAAPRAP